MVARQTLPASSSEAHQAHADLPCTLPSLSFQQVTLIKSCNPCVLITIRIAGGGWGPLLFACSHCCKFAPLFSISCRMLLPQPLSFHAFASLPGDGIPPRYADLKFYLNCGSARSFAQGRGDGLSSRVSNFDFRVSSPSARPVTRNEAPIRPAQGCPVNSEQAWDITRKKDLNSPPLFPPETKSDVLSETRKYVGQKKTG